MLENLFIQYLREHNILMNDLRLVRKLNLPQCYIAAGYIRNYIWDRLHGYEDRASHQDIDVVYYDPHDATEDRDIAIENVLIKQTGNMKWSVKNQARMHIRNGAVPYESTVDALRRWPETATAVGAILDNEENIQICAPYGLTDLFDLVVRRSPLFIDRNYYLNRVTRKEWKKQWPLLVIRDH